MVLTGSQLLTGFSRFLNDHWSSTTTSAGTAGGTTLVDTLLGRWGDRAVQDMYFRWTDASGPTQYQFRRATNFTASSGTATLLPAFDAQVPTSGTYDMHRYDPDDKFEALDVARIESNDVLFQEIHDDTTTTDGRSLEFTIPSSIRQGPTHAIIETPLGVHESWNVLSEADGLTTDNWTAAGGVVASTVTQDSIADIIPKDENSATRLVYTDAGSDGTYTQAVADMVSDFSAVRSAGRRMVVGWWVHSRDAGPVVEIVDDDGTAVTSSAHQGLGWEFLSGEADIAVANATTLSVRIRFPNSGSAAHRRVHLQHRFLSFEGLPSAYQKEHFVQIERDDTLKVFWLHSVPLRGRQIRLIGKDLLTALGTTAATQVTNSMELDDPAAELLYAKAAELLLGKEVLATPKFETIAARIAVVSARERDLVKQWAYTPKAGRVRSPYEV